MPGAFAHLSLLNEFTGTSLNRIEGLPREAKRAYMTYTHFAYLGAVSPDYPYLKVGDSGAAKWADNMHYVGAGRIIANGIDLLKQWDEERGKLKLLVWLMGYAAHVGADMTIHPVVQLKVGEYAENKTQHRVCEMNQDAYIFPRRLNLSIKLSEFIDGTLMRCHQPGEPDLLDRDLAEFWLALLRQTYPVDFNANPPDPFAWHSWFTQSVDAIEESSGLFPLARHVAAGQGLAYPAPDEIDMQFIENLEVPGGARMDYEAIFDRAYTNIETIWGWIAHGVFGDGTEYQRELGDWNLDTGVDGTAENNVYFWSGKYA